MEVFLDLKEVSNLEASGSAIDLRAPVH